MPAPSTRLTELAQRRIGSTLRRGKYTLDALLGVGSMGAVYRATHRNGSQVAVKMLHTELVGDDETHARFLREGYIMNQVDHPGLVRVLDDDVDDDGATFLVLELLHGHTLEDEREARGGVISPLPLLAMVRDLLDVLGAVHARGVVHRDLKPENVFLTTKGQVKLLDLGIARLGKSRLTAVGQTLGSPSYMSPEQASGQLDLIDARSDLFGVGAILFTLLTGRLIQEGPNAQARIHQAATQPARSLFAVWPDAKGALANLVDVALRFDRTQRWSSAEEMQRAIDSVMQLMSPSLPAPSPTVPERAGRTDPAGPVPTVSGWPSPWSKEPGPT